MPVIPAFMLKKLYVQGSLANTPDGFSLALKNTLAQGTIVGMRPLVVDGREYPPDSITVTIAGLSVSAAKVGKQTPHAFPIGVTATLQVQAEPLVHGEHSLAITVETREVGELNIEVTDRL
ncbi:MAG: hypothetical protein GX605_11520 [Chloroflexi bacterium]|nr:hypothetical protein [Chloroflexota bacterium]